MLQRLGICVLLAACAPSEPGPNGQGGCVCDVTYACDPGCQACDPECGADGERGVKDPGNQKPVECAFGGTYSYVIDHTSFTVECGDSDVISDLTRNSSGELSLIYDSESDLVFVNGPFGAHNSRTDLVLEPVEVDGEVLYQASDRTLSPNPYDDRYGPLAHAVMISLPRALIQTPQCKFDLAFRQSVGFEGGFFCSGEMPIQLTR